MTKTLSMIAVLLAAAAGCSHPQQCPAAVSATPPSLTSAPVPSNMPPPPPSHAVAERGHVWRLDFVLTPKDPKDATLAPTTFTLNIPDHQSGEIMVGKNVPLQVSGPPVPVTGGGPAVPHLMTPRQDVGLKVKAHIQPFANGGEDFLMDVDLELSAVDGGGGPAASIRKVTARGAAVAMGGKSSMIVSLDDDKRHYELTVTPTKLR